MRGSYLLRRFVFVAERGRSGSSARAFMQTHAPTHPSFAAKTVFVMECFDYVKEGHDTRLFNRTLVFAMHGLQVQM